MDREVDLVVRDSGGPDRAPAAGSANPDGQGLVGIAERAALTGGRTEAGRGENGGWTVHAVLPLQARAPEPPAAPQPSGRPEPSEPEPSEPSEKELP